MERREGLPKANDSDVVDLIRGGRHGVVCVVTGGDGGVMVLK